MSQEDRKIRVLIAKMGLDGHDIGARVLCALLRDRGFEVIYLGLYQTQNAIVKASIEEDVDAIGISFLCGEHLFYTSRVAELLTEKGVTDKLLIVGGVIPSDDIPKLKEMGVAEVFAGKKVKEVAEYLMNNVKHHDNHN